MAHGGTRLLYPGFPERNSKMFSRLYIRLCITIEIY